MKPKCAGQGGELQVMPTNAWLGLIGLALGLLYRCRLRTVTLNRSIERLLHLQSPFHSEGRRRGPIRAQIVTKVPGTSIHTPRTYHVLQNIRMSNCTSRHLKHSPVYYCRSASDLDRTLGGSAYLRGSDKKRKRKQNKTQTKDTLRRKRFRPLSPKAAC